MSFERESDIIGAFNTIEAWKSYQDRGVEHCVESCSQVNTREYLSRIGIDTDVCADADGLRMLQRRHLMSVPFENLDIHWKRPIVLDTDRFYSKIVRSHRGGFCYELNGLFNLLLRAVGFRTRLISARVYGGERGFGPEFDHAAIIVTIGEMEYLADVGFGDFAFEPLQFAAGLVQHDRESDFVLNRAEFGVLEVAKLSGGTWEPQYAFEPLGRDLAEFAEMCDFQQASPESHFTKGKICSIVTENGRKTLTDDKYIVTSDGERFESAVGSDDEFNVILEREFGISPPKQ